MIFELNKSSFWLNVVLDEQTNPFYSSSILLDFDNFLLDWERHLNSISLETPSIISKRFNNHGKDRQRRQENIPGPYWLISDLIPKKSEKFEFRKNFVTIFFTVKNLKNVDLYVASVNTVNSIKLLVKHVNHISSNFTQVTSSPNRMTIKVSLTWTKLPFFITRVNLCDEILKIWVNVHTCKMIVTGCN